MRPILYSAHVLGGQELALHSYGVAIAVGFFVAIFLGIRAARRQGEDHEAVQDLCFWLLVSSMLGARLLFVLTNVPQYATACSDAIASHSLARALWGCSRALHVWEGGLVFYGGFLAAVGFAAWYTRRRKLSFARIADLLAPSVAIGHFFGRLGCYAAGCCWGTPASAGVGVRFPPDSLVFQQLVSDGKLSAAAMLTPPLHPVQLYEALGNLVLFFALQLLAKKKRYDGQVLVAYLIGYAILRYAMELLRGDALRRFLLPHLSTSQAIALVTVPFAIALSVYFKRRQAVLSRA
jgi:phosphatidylglycerol---prolipoprotein diacylglyceryl transferase